MTDQKVLPCEFSKGSCVHCGDTEMTSVHGDCEGWVAQDTALEMMTADRDHWFAQHKECTRLLGEAMQETTDVSVERDALTAAARLALAVLDSYDAEEFKAGSEAIAALKAVL